MTGGKILPGLSADGRCGLSRAEVARTVPTGSRRAGSQREALRCGLACPDLADVRADFREHLRDWWTIHVCHASWGGAGRPPRGTTEPTRARVCELAGMSPSTYKACRRWWEARGYIAIVRPGSTPDLRPAVLSSPADGNVRQAYVLCMPREGRPVPLRTAPRPLSRPLSKSRRDLDKLPAREARGQGDAKPGRTGGPRSPVLCRGTLKGLTDGWWAHITAPFTAWSASDVVWAIDHLPDGRQHRTRVANIRHPAGWLRWRLSHWLRTDGTPLPSPTQARAEAAARHRAYLADRERLIPLADRAAHLRRLYRYDHTDPADTPALTACTERSSRPAHRTVAAPRPELPAWWTDAVAAAARAVEVEEGADSDGEHRWNGGGRAAQALVQLLLADRTHCSAAG
jgi:hypothetical protein